MENIRFETDCMEDGIHQHKEMEILFVLQGRCAVFMNNKNFILKPEDFVVFNPFESHQLYREDGSHTLSFYISMEFLTETGTKSVSCVSVLQPEKKASSDLLRMRLAEIFRDTTEDPAGRKLNIQAELLELASILQKDFSRQNDGASSSKVSAMDKNERKQQFLSYIWEHYREPLTLEAAAKHFYLSGGHFSRLFHDVSGMSFSAYLKEVRLLCAKSEMERGNLSVTEIALSCGFGSVNTFIGAFRKAYGKTPGAFIRLQKNNHIFPQKNNRCTDRANGLSEAVSYMSLMRYQIVEKKDSLLSQPEPEIIRADLAGERRPFSPVWKKTIGVAYAKDLLFEIVQKVLVRSVDEINVEGFLLHGIFNDELGICRRASDQTLIFNFTYMDIILDFLVEKLHVTPWLFLDYTPRCLVQASDIRRFGSHIVSLPTNLEEWSQLVRAVLKHIVKIYGKQQVSQWVFSVEQAMQVSVGNCEMEHYKAFYLASYQAIKSVLPQARILGFGLDTGFVDLPKHHEFEALLLFSKAHNCVPDILSFQCFCCDYSKAGDQERIDINYTEDEVYPLSEDEDILSKELDQLQEITTKHCLKIPVAVMVFNPGMWGRNPGNDTCFQAAAMIKNAIENRDRLFAFSAGGVSDYPEKLLPVKSMYHGGMGMFTYNGIPKASYLGLQLLSRIRGAVVGEGKGYFLTCTSDRKQFYLLLYYYCPYHLARHRKTALSLDEERNYDRYYEFEDMGAKSMHIFLENLPEGKYILETCYVNRGSGSSYDIWMKMGAPDPMKQSHLHYLECRSIPEFYTDTVNVKAEGKMVMSVFLEPHEVRLIHGMMDEKA